MKTTATIQARMGSSRLPGKVLKPICGKPMLQYQIERVKRARLVDEIVVATTTSPNDDPIVELAEALGVGVYRGPEDDVLKRIADLLKAHDVELHVELIGDSPLTDPQLVDEMVGFYLKNADRYDYVTNGMKVTYPSGAEVNVYPAAVLIEAESNVAPDDPEREHVDIHISRNDKYRRCNLEAPAWFHRPDVFIEVDTEKDFEMMSTLIGHFVEQGREHFSLWHVLEYLDAHPELAALNRNEERRWWKYKERPEQD